ncbi:uncharacterized protein [Diadema antillarum]|uniref:uncharacterized protein n=1 Tax=Diadema antillarum TaxID=105358 RepID=UPI003A8B5CF5
MVVAAEPENENKGVTPESSPKTGDGQPTGDEDGSKAAENTKSGNECSECGKPAKFYSIYQKERTVFCSPECHAKRNGRETTPNLMLVQLDDNEDGKGEDGEKSGQHSSEVVEEEIDEDIFEACQGGLANNKILHKLLEGGANVNQKDANDQPLLLCAAANGDVTTLNLLLQKGADINQRGKGKTTPLMIAAETGAKEKVTFLLSKDADTTLTDEDGKTALHRTERIRVTKCAELLIEKNPELLQAIDNCQQTVLHQAAGEGNKVLVDYLLEKGADVTATDNLKRSALHWSVIQGMESVVESLVKQKDCSKVIDEPDRFGVRPIHYAIQSNRPDIAELLINQGCELEAGESRGLTALIYAAACGKKDMLALMIPRCKNIDITDTNGWTALHHAAKRGDESVCALLLDHKANPDLQDEKRKQSPLFLAVNNKHAGIAKLIVGRNSGSVNIKDDRGRSVLHYASEQGQLDMVNALVESESSPENSKDQGNSEQTNLINSPDSSGHTALYLSAQNSHRQCCELLLQKGAVIDDISRPLLFELGLGEPEVEEEKAEDDGRGSLSPKDRYGVEEKAKEEETIEDLDLGGVTDTDAIALNSRYIYEGLGPPPKSSPRTGGKGNVIPRRQPSVDHQESFNIRWKQLLKSKRRAERNIMTRGSQGSPNSSSNSQSLTGNDPLTRNNGRLRPPAPGHSGSRSAMTSTNVQKGRLPNRSQSSRSSMPINQRSSSNYSESKRYSYSVVTR